MIRALIFDFNGVLVDDEHLHFELFREVLADEGVAITSRDYHERFLGLDDRGCFEAALAEAGQEAGPRRLDELIARKGRRYFERAREGLRIFPGARACLANLADRFALAINSGALRPEIEYVLDLLEVRDRVAAIVSAEDTTRCKPHPEGYLLALAALQARLGPELLAEHCLVVEDSLAGIVSAKGAGMPAIGVANTYPAPDLESAGADFVLTELAPLTASWIDQRF